MNTPEGFNAEIFCVHDSKAEAYIAPFVQQNQALAIRQVSDIVNSGSEHVFAKHPEDFTLFKLGFWDEKTGSFMLHDAHISVCNLVELKDASE